jgi:hypothetical protein
VGGRVEIVEHHDVVAKTDQFVDDVRADEPGSTGNEHPHAQLLRQLGTVL